MLHLTVQAIKVLVVAALAVVAFGWARDALARLTAASAPPDRTVVVVVAPNESSDQVAQDLQASGLIRSATVFRLDLRLTSPGGGLSAGRHVLHSGMTVAQIITSLTQPTGGTSTPTALVPGRLWSPLGIARTA